MTLLRGPVPSGIILPESYLPSESFLQSEAFAVLAAFVAINTVMYGALAVAKMLPKVYVNDWFTDDHRRAESRSIHPRSGADA
jgi:hypothetical protein